ncbi:uncharacterized protein LOC121869473 [Homarus americanus]|uniref:uncharacterized protein LOC121869473 n=1 Tax=Homarus americanus TaxID=6706 RepID=UPI001C46AEB6|nr:uncharacterized protein LOC121869473 [Homarus americanus]
MTGAPLLLLLSLLSLHTDSVWSRYEGQLDSQPTVFCEFPFTALYKKCIFVDPETRGSWNSTRTYCLEQGGDLIKVDSADFMFYLVRYIHENGYDHVSYWIGGSDEDNEGDFRWTDGTEMKMGTPFWGDSADQIQEPDGGISQNCVFMNKGNHYYFFDYGCRNYAHAICEQVDEERLEDVLPIILDSGVAVRTNFVIMSGGYIREWWWWWWWSSFINTTHSTMTGAPLLLLLSLLSLHKATAECYPPFTAVYHTCIFIDSSVKGTWYSTRNFCQDQGGDLVKVDSGDFMYYLVRYIHDNGHDQHSYWIGGSDEHHEGDFRWTDGTEVKMGTPFWGDSADQIQEPDGGINQNCMEMNHVDHYYFFDVQCDGNLPAICEQTV